MEQSRDRILTDLLGIGVLTLARILQYSCKNSRVRFRLGKIYSMMQQYAHDNYSVKVRNRYDIHPTVTWGVNTMIYGDGMILIGEQIYIGRDSFIMSNPGEAKIVIGKHCAISHSVHIRTGTYNTRMHFADALESQLDWANIAIGDFVWFGAHTVICGGVTIGDNSIIGANSVVTHDVPSNTIFGGIPARLIGR